MIPILLFALAFSKSGDAVVRELAASSALFADARCRSGVSQRSTCIRRPSGIVSITARTPPQP